MTARFRWTGQVIRIEDDRIPKRTLYGQLADGHWTVMVHVALMDNSSGSRTVSRPVSISMQHPAHGARIPGTGPESLASLLQRCHRRIRRQQNTIPEGQATHTSFNQSRVWRASIPHRQFSCDDVCGRILCFEDRTDFTFEDASSYRRLSPSIQTTKTPSWCRENCIN